MAINIIHHIVLDPSPTLTRIIELLTGSKADEKLKQEIMNKLNKLIVDVKSTV